MTKFEDRCMVCDAVLAGLTATCPGCGSVYRRGELVEEHVPKPKQPAMAPSNPARQSKAGKCPTCGGRGCKEAGDPYHHTFTSWQPGKTKEEAVENMFGSFDKYPGRRRLPAREAFEVVQVRHAWVLDKDAPEPSLWTVYVRKKRGRGAAQEVPPAPEPTPEPAPAAPEPAPSPYEGKRGRHPAVCGCTRHFSGRGPSRTGTAAV